MPGQDDDTADVTDATSLPDVPAGLLKRGRGLWDDKVAAVTGNPVALMVLAEACRAADRCERLDAQLRGRDKDWLRMSKIEPIIHEHVEEEGVTVIDVSVTVVMNAPLREARQQQGILKQLLVQLDAFERAAGGSPESSGKSTSVPGTVTSIMDKVNARNA